VSTPTFYTETELEPGNRVALEGKEAWHALGVKRLNPGDSVRLIDGQGTVAKARVDTVDGRQSALLEIILVEHFPRLQPDIILATAVAKGDHQATLLDMATQLGISAWQPLACQRSVSHVGKNSYQRWQKICLEACKQSGSAWLPGLLPALSPEAAAARAIEDGRQVLFAHPAGEQQRVAKSGKLILMIGPEGGFTDSEVSRLDQLGAVKQGLGRNILRIETAAVSMLAKYRLG
jgi:16S rRNA (uracil1498-N3)-methyltransferase